MFQCIVKQLWQLLFKEVNTFICKLYILKVFIYVHVNIYCDCWHYYVLFQKSCDDSLKRNMGKLKHTEMRSMNTSNKKVMNNLIIVIIFFRF